MQMNRSNTDAVTKFITKFIEQNHRLTELVAIRMKILISIKENKHLCIYIYSLSNQSNYLKYTYVEV